MKFNKRNFTFAALVASLLSPFLFMSSSMSPWENVRFPLIFQEIVYPIEYSWKSVTGFTTTIWSDYVSLVHTNKENTVLKQELDRLKAQTIDYNELHIETNRLRKLLGFIERSTRPMLVAKVIGSPVVSPFYSIRLSKGSLDNVKVGMPVIAPDGVFGRIIRVGLNFSDVLITTDSNFNLDVLVQRNRIRGVIRGSSGGTCLLNLHKRSELRIGDTIITSGIVGGYPKGLPVGEVVKISYSSDHVTQVITVKPWVDYTRVEEAFIIPAHDQDIQKIIDTAGNDWIKNTVNRSGGG